MPFQPLSEPTDSAAHQLTTLNFANFKSSCFVPALRNSTVAFSLSPEPSNLMMVPMPKRWCSMTLPSRRPPADGAAGGAEADGAEGRNGRKRGPPAWLSCRLKLSENGSTGASGLRGATRLVIMINKNQ